MSMFRQFARVDEQVLLLLQRLRFRLLNRFFVNVTFTGEGKAWFSVAAVLLVMNQFDVHLLPEQPQFFRAMQSPLLAWALSSALKRLAHRPRPSARIEGFFPAIPAPGCGSFPSSHAASSSALFFALLYQGHPLAGAVGVWSALLSFSRLYLGVHFPSDIAAGILLGLVSSSALHLIPVNGLPL